jgi:hypothetical protein
MTDYERGYFQGKADSIKIMQQALDALEKTKPKISQGSLDVLTHDAAITALREKLKEQK